ncbi:MAG: hypothetical protein K6C08_01760 [Oscillospiraceae bacterium]|nr:hypothetical protein [Oscillospiraceae bacterium]
MKKSEFCRFSLTHFPKLAGMQRYRQEESRRHIMRMHGGNDEKTRSRMMKWAAGLLIRVCGDADVMPF